MNLVRLTFILGMLGLAGWSLYTMAGAPYHEPVAHPVVTGVLCNWDGGYYTTGYIVIAIGAIAGASAVALTDLVRRVY